MKRKSTATRRQQVLDGLGCGGWLTGRELAYALKLDLMDVRNDVARLLKAGKLLFKPEKYKVNFNGSFATKTRFRYSLRLTESTLGKTI